MPSIFRGTEKEFFAHVYLVSWRFNALSTNPAYLAKFYREALGSIGSASRKLRVTFPHDNDVMEAGMTLVDIVGRGPVYLRRHIGNPKRLLNSMSKPDVEFVRQMLKRANAAIASLQVTGTIPPSIQNAIPQAPVAVEWNGRNLTQRQFWTRLGGMVAWTVLGVGGCEATKRQTLPSVHVQTRYGTYQRRRPGEKMADDRANLGTLWERVLIFGAWAASSFVTARKAFFERVTKK